MILIVIPYILKCVQQIIDKTIKKVFIIQEREIRNRFTESSQNLTETVDKSIDMEESFELSP